MLSLTKKPVLAGVIQPPILFNILQVRLFFWGGGDYVG